MMHWATGSARRWPEAFHHLCVPLSAFQKPFYSAFAVWGSVNLVRWGCLRPLICVLLSLTTYLDFTLNMRHRSTLLPRPCNSCGVTVTPPPPQGLLETGCKHSGCSVPVSDHHFWALMSLSLTTLSPTSSRQKKLFSVLGGEKLCFISTSILSSILSVPQSFHFSWITQIFWKSKSRNVFSPPSSALFAKKSV